MSTRQRHLLRKATAVSIAGAIAVFGMVASATPSAAQEPDSTITGVTSHKASLSIAAATCTSPAVGAPPSPSLKLGTPLRTHHLKSRDSVDPAESRSIQQDFSMSLTLAPAVFLSMT